MPSLSPEDLSNGIHRTHFFMPSTGEGDGGLSIRPINNNGNVEYHGEFWIFSYEDTRKVAATTGDPQVNLSLSACPSLLGKTGIFTVVNDQASIIKDKAAFEELWVEELEPRLEQGVGFVRIKSTWPVSSIRTARTPKSSRSPEVPSWI
jgi:general stress protein 26